MLRVLKSIFLLFSVSFVSGQFGDVEISLDTQWLKETDRVVVEAIPEQLKIFFATTPWDEEYADLAIPLSIQMIFESAADKGGERLYTAQCSFAAALDQRYFARGIQFRYAEGQIVAYSPVIFEPLASTMEYYGYIILAGEADTYHRFGGSRFYERGRDLALEGERSFYPRGWSDRIDLVDQLTKNRGLRLVRFFFYEMDALVGEKKFAAADTALAQMIKNLELTFTTFPREYYTMIFLNGHAHEFCDLPLQLKNRERLLRLLIEMDPANKETYEEALEVKSEKRRLPKK